VSSGSSWSAGSSPALTEKDVENQVDASFSKWFGQLDNSIDKKVTAAATAAVAKEIKVSHERTEIWTGKMFTAIDNQARQTEKCSVDMAKLMFRMGQLEAGTAGHYNQVGGLNCGGSLRALLLFLLFLLFLRFLHRALCMREEISCNCKAGRYRDLRHPLGPSGGTAG
jgi:hypothetical protein